MKRSNAVLAIVLVLILILPAAGCSKEEAPSIVGVWEYSEEGMAFTYDLKDDGTGTYTMNVGNEDVVYELKYEVKDGHLLVTYVNNETFSEEDVFDSEFSFQDENTLIIKDSFGSEMTFVRK